MPDTRPEKPYKFLDPYGLHDASIFFGRDRETRILLSDVVVNRLVVLFAPSGTGKTSLINAGVRPRLHDKGYTTFFVRVNEDPVASALAELRQHPALVSLEDSTFGTFLEAAVTRLHSPLVLFFDQFEEFFVFILRRQQAAARAFIEDVARLYRNRDSGVHLVFSMREEFFVEMDAFRDEIPTIFHNESNLRLRPFDAQQTREAIVQPARVFGTEFEPALVDRLIADLSRRFAESGDPGVIQPAQLQIVCDRLWQTRRNETISLEQYLSFAQEGGLNIAEQILYNRFEQSFSDLSSADDFELLARILPELRSGEGTKAVRDVPGLFRALNPNASPETALRLGDLIDRLVQVQFIRASRRDQLDVVELSHDYLVLYLDELTHRIRLIWPHRQLAAVRARRATGGSATPDQLDAIAGALDSLSIDADEAWYMFEAALDCGYSPEFWFKAAAKRGFDVWHRLHEFVQDPQQPAARLSHAIDLSQRVMRDETVPAGMRAFEVLEAALDRDDLTVEAQQTIAKLSGSRNEEFRNAAIDLLIAFVKGALEGGRTVTSSATTALGRIERIDSIDLLTRELVREELTLDAQAALAVLTTAAEPMIAERATHELCDFLFRQIGHGLVSPFAVQSLGRIESRRAIELLGNALSQERLAPSAKAALEQLAGSSRREVQKLARAALSLGFRRGTAPPGSTRPPGIGIDYASPARRRMRSDPGLGESMLAAIARQIGREDTVLLLGAGVHAPPPPELDNLYPAVDRPPMRTELTARIAFDTRFESEHPGEPLDYFKVLEHAEQLVGRATLYDLLHSQLQEHKKPSPVLRAIARLPVQVILTTNYDQLLEEALRAEGKSPRVVPYPGDGANRATKERQLIRPSSSEPVVVMLHGQLSGYNSHVVLTDDDFAEFIVRSVEGDGWIPHSVRAAMQHGSMLVLGTWLGDYRSRFLLRWLRGDAFRTSCYALDPNPSPLLNNRLETLYGTKVIPDDIWSFVPALLKRVSGEDGPFGPL
jgi:hypothetical protein